MAARKGRGYGDVDPQAAPEAQDLALYLRELLQRSVKTQRDIEGPPTGYGKSRIQEFLSGKAVPSPRFLENFVAAVTAPRERQVALARCHALRQKAIRPAPAPTAPATDMAAAADPAAAATAALANMATTAVDRAALAQEQLTLAYQRNEELSAERDRAQQLVLALGSLVSNLQQQAEVLGERRDKEAEAQLAQLSEQLQTASQELARARAGRNEAERLAQRLRRRADELEETIAELRRTSPAPARTAEFALTAMPEELREAFFHADYDKVLSTAQGFLDQGQEMRDELVDEWGFAAPRRTPAQIIERWSTASHVLSRALGCLTMMAGALAHAAVTRAHASGWTFPLDLMILAGLMLCADPWEPARRLWPWLRAALRGDHLAGPLRISAQGAALRGVRCAAAVLATTGAVLCLTAATDWGAWWLIPLLPATTASAVYAVVGRDRHLGLVVQETVGQLAAELQTPHPHHPRTGDQKPALVLADRDWLDARRQELSDALTGGWTVTAGWVKAVVVIAGLLVAMGALGTLSAALAHTVKGWNGWNGGDLVTAVDHPVRRYLASHTAGLAVTASTVHWLWVATGVGLLVISWLTRSFSARLTWAVWGAATVVMVWSGTTGPARQVAAALALIAWGIASIAALRGLGRRAIIAPQNNITVNTDT